MLRIKAELNRRKCLGEQKLDTFKILLHKPNPSLKFKFCLQITQWILFLKTSNFSCALNYVHRFEESWMFVCFYHKEESPNKRCSELGVRCKPNKYFHTVFERNTKYIHNVKTAIENQLSKYQLSLC